MPGTSQDLKYTFPSKIEHPSLHEVYRPKGKKA